MDRTTWDEMLKNGTYVQELDWFALDSKGQVGVFTAIINAPIPGMVKDSFENYKIIKETIESLNDSTSSTLTTKEKGDFKDWLTYANKGLFAFDFQDIHRTNKKNQYDLIARPVMPINIKDLNLSVNIFPKLDCEFDKGYLEVTRVK